MNSGVFASFAWKVSRSPESQCPIALQVIIRAMTVSVQLSGLKDPMTAYLIHVILPSQD